MPVALILDYSSDEEMMASNTNKLRDAEVPPASPLKRENNHEKITSAFSSSIFASVVPISSYDDHGYNGYVDSEFDEDEDWSDSEDEDAMDAEDNGPTGSILPVQPSSLETAVSILTSPSVEIVDILAVMRALPWEARIQCLACEKLWIASWEDDDAEQLVDLGGIQLVLEAMSRFPLYESLQQCACETLQNVASLEDCPRLQALPQEEICQRGGVGLIVQAMQNHRQSHSLQLCGCTTLTSLAADHPENHATIQGEGGVDAIVQALRCHGSQHKAVALGARQALEALGYQDPEKEC